jgi:phage gp45-like
MPGAEHVSAFFDGDRSHGVTLMVADRRYRLAGLEAGEVALYDDLGQAVHLTRSGIVIKGAGLPVTITDTPQVNLDAPTVTCTGNVNITGNLTAANINSAGYVKDSTGKSMANMRSVYDSHTHPANGQAPTQKT